MPSYSRKVRPSMLRFSTVRTDFSILALAAFTTILTSSPVRAAAEPKPNVAYTIDFSKAANHYVDVTMDATATTEATEVMMPVWTPGSYLVREYARHLDSLEVTDANGDSIAFEKTRKNRWTLETQSGQPYRLRYRLYCNEVSVRTNFTNHYFAVLNGAATFLTPIESLATPYEVRLKLPAGWRLSASSLVSHEPHQYIAKDFDELVDSPIVAGQLEVFPFEVEGVPHQLVQIGDGAGYWNGTKAAADLREIVSAQAEFWQQVPYDRYLFLNVVGEGRGGLEHDYSCL
ncbi:MAG: hypothetical protein AAGJ83_12740, partial [Planctomycetota bacterium]